MHPAASAAPAYTTENERDVCLYRESDPPPSYNEIHSPTYGLTQQTSFQNNYGACPTVPPPPYTPSPSYGTPTRAQKSEYIPESGVMMPLNISSSTSFQTEETSSRKKYAAYVCCAVFLLLVMIAAYLGRGNRKHNSHYRYNFDWNS